METIFFSTDQALLFLIVFSLIVFLLALLIDKSNGLFLARNPFDANSYEATPENENERKAGKLFVKWTYRVVSILIPLFLLFYSNMFVKIAGIIFIIAILVYQNSKKNRMTM